jgi:16S rRNA (adenine1518-N6/adenine1519-N6)-dimethyltransferase
MAIEEQYWRGFRSTTMRRARILPGTEAVRARKRFAQHFLEPAWVEKLIRLVGPAPTDWLVEIGPGRGALTVPLSPLVERVLAVEIDRDLAQELSSKRLPNVIIVAGDILELDLGSALRSWRAEVDDAPPTLRVVGNLPYNISTPLLFRCWNCPARPGCSGMPS